MVEIITVSSKGQVVIPKEIRDIMGIERQDKFILVHDKDSILLKRIKEGDLIFKIYSDSPSKLKRAEKIYNSTGGPVILGGMMIEQI